MLKKDCAFCSIVGKDAPGNIIFEDDLVCCFLDIDPINEGHVLIVPKKHCHDVDELEEETFIRITKLSRKMTKVMKKAFHPDGYTIMQNGGKFTDFGHYHLHIFPRYVNDEFGWNSKELDNQSSFESVREKLRDTLVEIN
ncbi:HIT family protein [Rossellomorea aquimaris]|uniref:HIT family protein n=1 Tax=Rossellomorea aquimaris TaxID=189382 RepID=UPI0007D0B5ED|nr:HIT family protein [Rossellomorea aquimaris]